MKDIPPIRKKMRRVDKKVRQQLTLEQFLSEPGVKTAMERALQTT